MTTLAEGKYKPISKTKTKQTFNQTPKSPVKPANQPSLSYIPILHHTRRIRVIGPVPSIPASPRTAVAFLSPLPERGLRNSRYWTHLPPFGLWYARLWGLEGRGGKDLGRVIEFGHLAGYLWGVYV